jgi:3(or 17)beta-hydroxysteroid dehydrogenase
MMGRVQGKVAIVTGAGRGLGFADAMLLAREGATVIATDIECASVADLEAHGVRYMPHDVRDEYSWKDLVARVLRDHGQLDVLVNNAGVVHVGDPVNFDIAEWRHMSEVNIEGVMLGCKHALPPMIERRSGSIINISSISAHTGLYFYGGYCASKGAVASYSRAVAVYCAQNKLGIRCNSIHPGGIDTPINGVLAAEFAERLPTMRLPPQSPVSADGPQMRMGEPDDIAWAVVYLASEESKFMSGSEIRIDNTASVTAAVVG